MFVHVDQKLSGVLARVAAAQGEPGFPPLLVTGRQGVGKRHVLHHFARHISCRRGYRPFAEACGPVPECGCEPCSRMEADATVDYVTLSGRQPLADIRDFVRGAVQRAPTLLPARIVLVRRLDHYTPAALDALLGLVEEPPTRLRILATSAGELPAHPLLSRFHKLRHACLSAQQMRDVVGAAPHLRALAPALSGFPFRSPGQLVMACTLGFEARFQEFFVSRDFVGVERRVRLFLGQIRADGIYGRGDALEFFGEWLAWRIRDLCEREQAPGSALDAQRLLQLLPGVLRRHQGTLGRFVNAPHPEEFINVDNQFVSMIQSLNLLHRFAVAA